MTTKSTLSQPSLLESNQRSRPEVAPEFHSDNSKYTLGADHGLPLLTESFFVASSCNDAHIEGATRIISPCVAPAPAPAIDAFFLAESRNVH